MCAFRSAGVDVNLPLQIAALDASIGRVPDLTHVIHDGSFSRLTSVA